MPLLSLLFSLSLSATDSLPIYERIDSYHPINHAYLGASQDWYSPEGHLLRWMLTSPTGDTIMTEHFFYDEQGRRVRAFVSAGNNGRPERIIYSYSADGRSQTIRNIDDGYRDSRSEVTLDERGREVIRHTYRQEDTPDQIRTATWDSLDRQVTVSIQRPRYDTEADEVTYRYDAVDESGRWIQRAQLSKGSVDRIEVRTLVDEAVPQITPQASPFAPGRISTSLHETSPSFTEDGRAMVFARYDDDWTKKQGFIAYLTADGWQEELLEDIGEIYNLAIAPDGQSIFYSIRPEEGPPQLLRLHRRDGAWTWVENLTNRYRISGTYPCLCEDGNLLFYDAEGPDGAGIYSAESAGIGFEPAEPVYIPDEAAPFDVFSTDGRRLLVTRCFDDDCSSDERNGVWSVVRLPNGQVEEELVAGLPYAWGAQIVEELGLFIYTDGEDILAVPLEAVRF